MKHTLYLIAGMLISVLTVSAQVDLDIINANVSNNTCPPGGSIDITYTVKNLGNGQINETSFVGFYLLPNPGNCPTAIPSGSPLSTNVLPYYIMTNNIHTSTHTLTIDTFQPEGYYTLVLVADYEQVLSETNEINNNYCIPLQVVSGSDLKITGYSIEDTVVTYGDEIYISFLVENLGDQQVNTSTTSAIYLIPSANGCPTSIPIGGSHILTDILTTSEIIDNEDHESMTLSIDSNIPLGSYFMVFAVDANQAVNEANESNNIICVPFEVAELPRADFTVTEGNLSYNVSYPGGGFEAVLYA